MAEIPTVRVKSGDSYAIINESDFDAKVHEFYDEEESGEASVENMTKAQLLKAASESGVEVNDKMTKAQVVEAMKAAELAQHGAE